METYFDVKDTIESQNQLTKNRVDVLEIYVKTALKQYSEINTRFNDMKSQYNKLIFEITDFNDWYLRQNIFKKIWWSIKQLNYEQLKTIKENGSIQN